MSALASAVVLVLIYSPFQIAVEPMDDFASCNKAAERRVGELFHVVPPDGVNPIPRVIATLCTSGAIAK